MQTTHTLWCCPVRDRRTGGQTTETRKLGRLLTGICRQLAANACNACTFRATFLMRQALQCSVHPHSFLPLPWYSNSPRPDPTRPCPKFQLESPSENPFTTRRTSQNRSIPLTSLSLGPSSVNLCQNPLRCPEITPFLQLSSHHSQVSTLSSSDRAVSMCRGNLVPRIGCPSADFSVRSNEHGYCWQQSGRSGQFSRVICRHFLLEARQLPILTLVPGIGRDRHCSSPCLLQTQTWKGEGLGVQA